MVTSDSQQDLETSVFFLEQMLSQQGKEEQLKQLRQDEKIVVVSGEYDRIEQVLKIMGVPYSLARPADVNSNAEVLKNSELTFVNCAGSSLTRDGLSNIQSYVSDGGKLVTTDWAVEHVVQQIFPNTIRRLNKVKTRDEVVSIQPLNDIGQRLIGMDVDKVSPRWWLESSSYPIEIVNPAVVSPLIVSSELESKYGSPYIAVSFPYESGAVIHFVSHLKAQRTEVRNKLDGGSTKEFAAATGTLEPSTDVNGVTVAGLSTGVSTMTTVFELASSKAGDLIDVNSGNTPHLVKVIAEGYSSVNFSDAEQVDGISAIYDLAKSTLKIGRGSHNMINLGNSDVSRNHAELYFEQGSVYVRDLGSTNGVYVGDKKAGQIELGSKDTVKINPGTIDVILLEEA